MKKICIIYANCQNQLIAEYLSKSPFFIKKYKIKRIPAHTLIQGKKTIPKELLQQTKLFVFQPVKDLHGISSTKHILSKLPTDCQQISFPPLYFTGYHPQYCKNPTNRIAKPLYPYGVIPHGDTNIISMLAENKGVAEIVKSLSDPNFYDREFLLANVENSIAELARREASLSIKVSEFIKTHYRQHYLFHTINHPTDILGIFVVNQILRAVNLPELENDLFIDNPYRGVLDNKQIPIYPSAIANLQLSFIDEKAVYRHDSFCTNRMTFSRYIEEYIDLHRATCRATKEYFNGIRHFAKGQLKRAEDSLSKAIEARPNNTVYYRELGALLKQQGKYDRAVTVYQKAIELSPDWSDFYLLLGEVLLAKNERQSAVMVYEQALKLEPEDGEIYSKLGDIMLETGDLDAAEKSYDKAIQINPNVARYYRRLGDIFTQKSNWDLALDFYSKALLLTPNNAWIFIKISNIFAEQNKFEEAARACQQSIEIDNQNPHFYRLLGDIYYRQDKHDLAISNYQEAIKLNPNQLNLIQTQNRNDLLKASLKDKLVRLQHKSSYREIAELIRVSLLNNSGVVNRSVFGYIPALFREIEIHNPIQGISLSNLVMNEPVVYKIRFPSEQTMSEIPYFYIFCYLKNNSKQLNVYFKSAEENSISLKQNDYVLSQHNINFNGLISAFIEKPSTVCVSDPGHFIPGLSSSYYVGTSKINFPHLISNVIESICQNTSIALENTMLIGGSAGGMGALLSSTYFSGKVNVFAVNTQIFTYDLKKVMQKLLRIEDSQLLIEQYGDRVCCNHRFKQQISGIPNIYILANIRDSVYYRNYNFYQTYHDLFVKKSSNNQSVFDSYYGLEGHGPPLKELLKEKIKIARKTLTMKSN